MRFRITRGLTANSIMASRLDITQIFCPKGYRFAYGVDDFVDIVMETACGLHNFRVSQRQVVAA